MRRFLLLAAVLAPALVTAGCDTDTDDPIVFGGVEVRATGDASLAVEGGRLVVSGLEGTRSGGFVVAGTPTRVDVETEPVSIPAGGRFGTRVTSDAGLELASLYTEAQASGRHDFRFEFPDALAVQTAIVRYKQAGRTVFEAELSLGVGRSRRAVGSGGSGDGDPNSTHVVRERGKYIVVADSDDQGSRRANGCAGFVMTPPPPFDEEFQTGICADWVEIEPVLQLDMPEGEVAVTARGVGEFVVTDLAVRGGAATDG